MALPTTSLSFSALQTEFGGSNPISLGEYRRGGPYVPSGTTSAYGTIPTSNSNINMGVFRGTQKVVVAVNITDQYIYSGAGGFDFAEATATYALSNAGNAYFAISGDSYLQENYAGEWLVSGNGALVSAKATILYQSLGTTSILSGVYNTFQPLTSLRQWMLTSQAQQADSQETALVTLRIDLALTSDTNTILDTAEIQLETRAETAQ
jgi:hypothetical protein